MIATVKHFVPKVWNKDVSIMRIANILGIFALIFEICSGQEDLKKTKEVLDLFDKIKIRPRMIDQILALGEILKVLNRKPQNNLYAYRKQQKLQDVPEVLEKMSPTLIEMGKALRGTEDISDEHLIKWGKALDKEGRGFAK